MEWRSISLNDLTYINNKIKVKNLFSWWDYRELDGDSNRNKEKMMVTLLMFRLWDFSVDVRPA